MTKSNKKRSVKGTEGKKRAARFMTYIVILLWVEVIQLLFSINYIQDYIELKDYKENGVLVTAKLIDTANYERNRHSKGSSFWPGGNKDLTIEFELNGVTYRETYKNVDIYSTEANMDYYTHIKVYVLEDASDIQTERVVEECLERATYEFYITPGILFVLWVAGVLFWETKVLGSNDRKTNS